MLKEEWGPQLKDLMGSPSFFLSLLLARTASFAFAFIVAFSDLPPPLFPLPFSLLALENSGFLNSIKDSATEMAVARSWTPRLCQVRRGLNSIFFEKLQRQSQSQSAALVMIGKYLTFFFSPTLIARESTETGLADTAGFHR